VSEVFAPRRLACLAALALTYALCASGTAHAACAPPTYGPPSAQVSVSDSSPAYGVVVSFDGRASAPGTVLRHVFDPEIKQCVPEEDDDPITSYAWSFGDGASASGSTADHGYASKGGVVARLTVQTAHKSSTQSVAISVRGVVASFDVSQTTEWTKRFDAGASSSAYPVRALDWQFGDGSTGSGTTATHTYAGAGDYSVVLTVTDVNGTSETATQSVHVAPDLTGPTIATATPKPEDIYLVGQPVVANYSCSDAGGSGLRSCLGTLPSGAAIDTSQPGDRTFTVTSEDVAGNKSSSSVAYHVVSAVPTVTITAPADGGTYPRGQSVSANYRCSVLFVSATCTGSAPDGTHVPNGAPFDTATLGHHTFAVTGRTPQGTTTTKTVGYDVVDGTAPTATVSVPGESAVIPRGKLLRAAYSCHDEDGGSGLVSCVGDRPVGAPIDTSTPGNKTFTVRAKDQAGNVGTTVARYFVSNYPTLPSSVGLKYVFSPRSPAISIKSLRVTRAPKGARITVRCEGRGCPQRAGQPVVAKRRGPVVLRGWAGTALLPGATLAVRITKPLATGVETVYRVGRNHRVRKTDRCLPPGEKPGKC
jgi:PKD repeat protein